MIPFLSTGVTFVVRRTRLRQLIFVAVVLCCNSAVEAQNSSLFQYPNTLEPAQGLPIESASWTYSPPLPPRVLKLHDIVSIRVDEMARSQADGLATSRKNTTLDAFLRSWVVLKGLRKAEVVSPNAGRPRIQGQTNELFRADSEVETTEALTFNIAAEIVDIRPNGTVMLEARKTLELNDNVWETTLSGVCRSDDIGPDNTVLSRNMMNLKIDKKDRGQVRDGYKRGWFKAWYDELAPF